MKPLIVILSLLMINSSSSEEYDIDEIYEKIELDYGTLDEDGNDISYIFTPTSIKQGRYEIEIADGSGDLYEIKGTNYFLKFTSYYGYAGYGDEGILIIGSNPYDRSFIKFDD
ncbi:hypothetical protein ACFOET_18510 [Parapedobacter deserti]|uniref:Uncharacterized protein n=1 Tax=Parapedobacter deserti TaxID=1912957 RepID=A0ABV7JS67_9SPHI